MPDFNFVAIAVASSVPLLIGYIYYHPKVLGDALSKELGNDKSDKKEGHHPLVYLFTLVFSFLIAMLIAGIYGGHDPVDRNLSHAVFHGVAAAIFMGVPTCMVIFMFENKSIKYMAIHAFYWIICMGLMGTIIGAFGY